MEALKERREIVLQVLKTLDDSISLFNECAVESRLSWALADSIIQRFEYTIDTFWKYLKLYLEQTGMVQETIGSPKGVLRFAFEAKLITHEEHEILRAAIMDRNDTSHSYNHELAKEIVERIPEYYETIKMVVERLRV